MPARQCSSVDLPEPEGPITATTSPGWMENSAPSSAGVGPYVLRRSSATSREPGGGHARHRLGELVEAGGGQFQPAQVGLEVEQGVVADQLVGEVAVALAAGQLAHQAQVLGALGVEHLVGGAAGEQGEDDLV